MTWRGFRACLRSLWRRIAFGGQPRTGTEWTIDRFERRTLTVAIADSQDQSQNCWDASLRITAIETDKLADTCFPESIFRASIAETSPWRVEDEQGF